MNDRVLEFKPIAEMFDIQCSLILLFVNLLLTFIFATKFQHQENIWKHRDLLSIPAVRLCSQFVVLSMCNSNGPVSYFQVADFLTTLVFQNLLLTELFLQDLGFNPDVAPYEIPFKFFIIYSFLIVNILCKVIGVILCIYVIHRLLPGSIQQKILELMPRMNPRLPIVSEPANQNRNMSFLSSFYHFISRCDAITLMTTALDCCFGLGAFNFANLSSCILSQFFAPLMILPGIIVGIYLMVYDGFNYLFRRIQGNFWVSQLYLEGLFGFEIKRHFEYEYGPDIEIYFSPEAEMYDIKWTIIFLIICVASRYFLCRFETSSKDFWKHQFLLMVPVLRLGSQFVLFAMLQPDKSDEHGIFFEKLESMLIQVFYPPASILMVFGFDLLTDQAELFYELIIEPTKTFIIYSNLALNTMCKIFGTYLLLHMIYRLLNYFHIFGSVPSVSLAVLGLKDDKKTNTFNDQVDELKELLKVHKEKWNVKYEKLLEQQRQTYQKLELIEEKLTNHRQEFNDYIEVLHFLLLDLQAAVKNQEKQIKLMVNLLLDLKKRKPQPEVKEKETNANCTICLERPSSVSIRPCGHVCCQICLKKHKQKHRECPFCRRNIEDTLQLYFP